MSQYTVLFDANVLYPAPMRDALMQLAVTDLFKAKWTADIHREWIDALLRNKPHRDRAALERTRDLMDRATRDCLVTGYEALVPALSLPDPDDRHVREWTKHGGHAARFLFATVSRPSRTAALVTATR